MKLRYHPVSYNGQHIDRDEFAYLRPSGATEWATGIVLPCMGPNPPGNNVEAYAGDPSEIEEQRTNPRCIIAITQGPADASVPAWHWDGNVESPTLSPSIGCDRRCGWHGHVIAGEITS